MATYQFKTITGGGFKYKTPGSTYWHSISQGMIRIEWDGADTVIFSEPGNPTFSMNVTTDTITVDGVTFAGTAEQLQDKLNDIAVFSSGGGGTPASPAQLISYTHAAWWGDSLTKGTTDGLPTFQLSKIAGINVYNGGLSGDDSTGIKNRMLAATDKYSWPTIIWAGRNNYAALTTVKADIAAMIAALTHTNYLVLSVTNASTEISGSAGYNQIATLNGDLSTLYGAKYCDVRAALVAAYDPGTPQDVTDHANDIPPSTLRLDSVHFNAAGYAVVAAKVYTQFAQLYPTSTLAVNLSSVPYLTHGAPESVTLNRGGTYQVGGFDTLYLPDQIKYASSIIVGNGGRKFTGTGANANSRYNTIMGIDAAPNMTTANNNVSVGSLTFYNTTTGTNNVAIGASAGFSITTGSNNVAIGYGTSNVSSGSGNIVIGANLNVITNTASNFMTIGNALYGTGINGSGTTISTGNIGIFITAPTARLHVPAGTTGAASLCIPHGVAPTSPVDGDMWSTTAGLFIRINGVTKTVTLT